VRVDEPAVAVAEALARYNASVCYVLRDKKLVGVITLPHFLEKILRD
jgi:CBS domain-containing protein